MAETGHEMDNKFHLIKQHVQPGLLTTRKADTASPDYESGSHWYSTAIYCSRREQTPIKALSATSALITPHDVVVNRSRNLSGPASYNHLYPAVRISMDIVILWGLDVTTSATGTVNSPITVSPLVLRHTPFSVTGSHLTPEAPQCLGPPSNLTSLQLLL
ncbi:hypothetical protein AVEN_272657-1 [Araneus ventricosus]|uniref:Uncharacterized protein n=1 Tax=Araneus ventricosus TaxID=182803 RepID=A0A4Y2NNH4_ARAVE|nr:hypothetical protein AVEN_272657-1 [Araneus ventricosus]